MKRCLEEDDDGEDDDDDEMGPDETASGRKDRDKRLSHSYISP
jgi:hypothetical protein